MKKKVLTKQQLQKKIIGKIQGDVIFFCQNCNNKNRNSNNNEIRRITNIN